MYDYLFPASLFMLPIIFLMLSGNQRKGKDTQTIDRGRWQSGGGSGWTSGSGYGSGYRGQSQKGGLCEVSGRNRLFLSPPLLTLVIDLRPAKLGLWKTSQVRRVEWSRPSILRKNLCKSKSAILQVPILHLSRQVYVQRILWTWACKVSSSLLVSSPQMTHWLHRDAVQQGHAPPCVDCKKQPQAIDELCLACNSSLGKSTDPRLKEISLQDPQAASRTSQILQIQSFPLTIFQLSITSPTSGKALSRQRSEKSTRFSSRLIWRNPVKLTGTIFTPGSRKEAVRLTCSISQQQALLSQTAAPNPNLSQCPVYLRPRDEQHRNLRLARVWDLCDPHDRVQRI